MAAARRWNDECRVRSTERMLSQQVAVTQVQCYCEAGRHDFYDGSEGSQRFTYAERIAPCEGVAAGAPDRSAACCYMALSHVTASTEISILGIFYYFKGTGPVMTVDLGKATSPVDVDVMPIFGLI